MTGRWAFLTIWAICAVVAVATAGLAQPELRHALLREGGPIESASAFGYLVAAAWLMSSPDRSRPGVRPAALVLLLLTARELDCQRWFTSGSMSKLSYYLDPAVPAFEKILVMAALVLCAAIAGRLWHLRQPFGAALRAREPFAYSLAAAMVLAPLTKLLDGLHRTLRDLFAFRLGPEDKAWLSSFEETLELGIPLTILLALLQRRQLVAWRARHAAGRFQPALRRPVPGG